jgi:hypothetical protein
MTRDTKSAIAMIATAVVLESRQLRRSFVIEGSLVIGNTSRVKV